MSAIQNPFTSIPAAEFEFAALELYGKQYHGNAVYREFCDRLGRTGARVDQLSDIPFLPIEFFKSKKVISGIGDPAAIFTSSGTTQSGNSKHYVTDLLLYEQSYLKGFEHFYGNISQYCVLALLPSYLERKGSSLVYMVDDLIKKSGHPASGFYLDDLDALADVLAQLDRQESPVLLIGVSFALMDLVERHRFQLKNTIVMETGGMKGRRKEMVREGLHNMLEAGFGVTEIHSEYGMTELLSQAYSKGNGVFRTPPWMRVSVRDMEDPLTGRAFGKTGGINIIDLANQNSCAFIATQDLGRVYGDGSFEILGRFDHSDIRGCNLMVL